MIHTRGCVELLVTVFRDHLIVIAFIAFGVGFVEVSDLEMLVMLLTYTTHILTNTNIVTI